MMTSLAEMFLLSASSQKETHQIFSTTQKYLPSKRILTKHKFYEITTEIKKLFSIVTKRVHLEKIIANWNFPLLGYYAASSGNFLPIFRGNLWVPNSTLKNLFGSSTPEGVNESFPKGR
jgi:hypothetical protein